MTDDDEVRNKNRRVALWLDKLRSRGVKAWCAERGSRENCDPIQEQNLKLIDRTVSLEVGDRLAIGSVDDGYRLVRITQIIDKLPNHVRSFAIEPVTAEK